MTCTKSRTERILEVSLIVLSILLVAYILYDINAQNDCGSTENLNRYQMSTNQKFKEGYHDSYITVIGNLVDACGNSSLTVYQYIDLKNSPIGIMYRCNNITMLSMLYSKYMRKE